MRKRILTSALIAFFALSSLAMIQPKAHALDLENAIVLTASEMEVCALFARLLEDIHMYALMRTNPLAASDTQTQYQNTLLQDGQQTLPSAIATIISKINSGVNTTALTTVITLFFNNGVNYVNSVVNMENIVDQRVKLINWKESATAIFFTSNSQTNPENIVNQLINAASSQVVNYFQHTPTGYQNGLNDNSATIQFAIAFGLALVNNNSNL